MLASATLVDEGNCCVGVGKIGVVLLLGELVVLLVVNDAIADRDARVGVPSPL